MSQRYYSEINLHITWHTKHSAEILTPDLEIVAYRDVRDRISKTNRVIFYEIGGTETHIHLAVKVPPTLRISEWIGQLKGGSSRAVNGHVSGREDKFAWQEGYGVVSFGTRNLAWVVEYIRNQKEHHASGRGLQERLERFDEEDEVPFIVEASEPVSPRPKGRG